MQKGKEFVIALKELITGDPTSAPTTDDQFQLAVHWINYSQKLSKAIHSGRSEMRTIEAILNTNDTSIPSSDVKEFTKHITVVMQAFDRLDTSLMVQGLGYPDPVCFRKLFKPSILKKN